MVVKPIPDGFHRVTPYIVAQGAARLIDFLKDAFGAAVVSRHDKPDGSVMHAQLKIGDSMIMLTEACDKAPSGLVSMYMYVEDSDAVYERALKAGGTSIMEMSTQFYGDRHGGVKDPSGNSWWVATHVEDVSDEEIARRASSAKP